MSVTLMAASCDSIGSCSLDVDAESLNGSLIDSAQVDSTRNHHNPGDHQANAPSLSKQTLHSLLLSAGTNSGGQISDNFDNAQANLSSPSPTAKKPSYLNLACSISGYGGITTYDSKLREGFRSRDHSPGKLIGIQNGSREASPARVLGTTASGNLLTAPNSGRLCWAPSPVGQGPIKSDMTNVSPTYGGGRRCNGSNGTDQLDATGNFNVTRISDRRNRWLESTLSPSEKNKDYQQVVTVSESKSGRHGVTTETSVETRYEVNSQSQSTVVSSKTVISSSSLPQQYSNTLQTERIIPIAIEGDFQSYQNGHMSGKQSYTNGSAPHHTPVSSKSFIQQRVERLYGPCALAQGFFHRSVKSSFSTPSSDLPETNGLRSELKSEGKPSPEKSEGCPELPVLRHLRPEFRDQLTVAPRKSLNSSFSPPNPAASRLCSVGQQDELITSTHKSQLKTSSEGLTDLQPAAPEVVLPQQSPSIAPMMKIADKCKVNEETEAALPSAVSVPEDSKIVKDSKIDVKSHGDVSPAVVPAVASSEPKVKDKEENAGHKFLKIQKQTIEKLLVLAKKAELEIEESGLNGKPALSEESLGHLRAAAGQARLLVTQKMVQFEGLCHKCISQHPNEPFPTTAEDLQGFWDMLLLQVDQVHNTFEALDRLKAAGWCEDELAAEFKPSEATAARTSTVTAKRTTRTTKATPSASAKSAEAAALRKQREEERRKLLEQRRRDLKQKQQAEENLSASKETVEIFGAQSS